MDLRELIADVKEQVLLMRELGLEALSVEMAAIEPRVVLQHPVKKAEEPRSQIPASVANIISDRPKPMVSQPSRKAGELLASLPSLSKRTTMPSRPLDRRADSVDTKTQSAEIGSDEIMMSNKKTLTHQFEEPTPIAVEDNSTLAASSIIPSVMPESAETIEQIRAEIGPDCTRCKLSTLGRKHVVNSTGNFNADLMFVGEAPGADEDEQGFPFVGRAGQLLTDIIEKGLEIPRAEVFIGNINRCRPPGNRAPEPDETAACKPFLQREIAVVRPKVIVVLGATAAQNLLETKVPIGKLRGRFHDYLGTKVMPTFHPAYLLRDPHKKREVWEDMKLVKEMLRNER